MNLIQGNRCLFNHTTELNWIFQEGRTFFFVSTLRFIHDANLWNLAEDLNELTFFLFKFVNETETLFVAHDRKWFSQLQASMNKSIEEL